MNIGSVFENFWEVELSGLFENVVIDTGRSREHQHWSQCCSEDVGWRCVLAISLKKTGRNQSSSLRDQKMLIERTATKHTDLHQTQSIRLIQKVQNILMTQFSIDLLLSKHQLKSLCMSLIFNIPARQACRDGFRLTFWRPPPRLLCRFCSHL